MKRKKTQISNDNSGVASSENKTAKLQHSRNIPARIASLPLNPKMKPTAITATEIIYQRCDSVMRLSITSEENKHLSAFLNAYERSLSLVKLRQNSIKHTYGIIEIIYGIRNIAQQLIVGSVAEGLDISNSDGDIIFIGYEYKVFKEKEYSCLDPGTVVLPNLDEGQPGYSKLRVLLSKRKLQHKYTYLKDYILYLKNNVKEELSLSSNAEFPFSLNYSIHGPAFNTEISDQQGGSILQQAGIGTGIFIEEYKRNHFDFVFCIRGTQWPVEASEWTTRARACDWPTRELFDQIIHTGYFLAAVGSKESQDSEMQWRVSFNKAEQLIVESLNETQIHCILLLKYLKQTCLSKIPGKNITSYTMKTVMFWCLEEKSEKYWQSSNLLCCFCFCVSKLKSFVEKGFLPNYFIRKRNQFVSSEFTGDIKTKTIQFLESFLEDPKAGIFSLLESYRSKTNTNISEMNIKSQQRFIEHWLIDRVSMVQFYQMLVGTGFLDLYDGYNIQHIFKRCNEALEKFKTVGYTQPLIKFLQNYMGVLQYILLKEEKEKGEHFSRTYSNTREKYSKYMKLSASGDLTHTNLRIATCYLDDGIEEDCLNIIRTVTNSDDQYFMLTHGQRIKQTLLCNSKTFTDKPLNVREIALYNSIIHDIDFIDQDPYRTTAEFEQLKKGGHALIGHDAMILAWKRCYFDVTFMLAELPVLPKPAALEFCIDNSKKKISFHPLLYGLLLEFLWHEKNGSPNRERQSILEKMKNCVSKLPSEQQSRGLNFIIYCYLLQNDYRAAARYLIQSFKLNPVEQNVAHLYMKYIADQLRVLSLDS